jgi:Cu2+-containing amine oxidase
LKQTDPLKYQETKLEIERKRTLDLINKTGKENIETIRQLNDSYLKKWDEISASDE